MAADIRDAVWDINPAFVHRLTVDEVRQMLAAGILHDGDPIELIDGLLVHKDRSDSGGNPMTHGERHARSMERLQLLASRVFTLGLRCRLQLPITLTDSTEPEPDVAVIRANAQSESNRHPGPQDVLAIIEVSDSSLQYDRTTKKRLYARTGIPIYWIVNIPEQQLEIYQAPDTTAGLYLQRTDVLVNGVAQLDLGNAGSAGCVRRGRPAVSRSSGWLGSTNGSPQQRAGCALSQLNRG